MVIDSKAVDSSVPTEYAHDVYSQEVLLFASLREVAGEKVLVRLRAGSTVKDLVAGVGLATPSLAPWLPYIRVAVNCEYAPVTQVLDRGDEIALLPPVSGGAQSAPAGEAVHALVTEQPLDVSALIAAVVEEAHGAAGAIVPFIGVVRDHARGQSVTHLEYQAYGSMAQAEMDRIAAEAHARWNCFCSCAHRTGSLQIGEASLVVVVATAHRAEGFEACRWIVDEIKRRVPVWKKEFAGNGTFWIEDPVTEPAADSAGESTGTLA